MNKIFKAIGLFAGVGIGAIVFLGTMAVTKTGFVIIDGWEIGVKKTETEYVMEEIQPGYHFFIPFITTIEDINARPVMFNWSKSDANKESTDEMRYNSMITGVDKNGIPLSFAIAMEITPVKSMMAEMYQETGSYENAMNKKAIQPSKSIIKDVMGAFDAKNIQGKRNEVSKMLNVLLTEFYKDNKYFNLDSKIDLKEIEVPKQIRDKQLEVQSAKQDAEVSAQLIVKAQNEAKSEAARAKGVADRKRIESQGIADAILLESTAQAKANDLISKSLTEKILRNNAIIKWDGVKSKVQAGNGGLILDLGEVSK